VDIKVSVLGTNLAEIDWKRTRKDYDVVLNRYLASGFDLIAALRWSSSVLWRPCEGGEREDDDLVSLSWERIGKWVDCGCLRGPACWAEVW
jgi:hypothetical protein